MDYSQFAPLPIRRSNQLAPGVTKYRTARTAYTARTALKKLKYLDYGAWVLTE